MIAPVASNQRPRAFRTFAFAAAVLVLAGVANGPPVVTAGFDPGRAGFSLRIGEQDSPYRLMSAFVIPGGQLKLSTAAGSATVEARASAGELRPGAAGGSWVWTAPQTPGLQTIVFRDTGNDSVITVNAFVLVPRSRVRGGMLGDYRIGDYPSTPLRGLEIYNPPAGFVEVTAENAATAVSPHFRLEQFVCKQESGYPKYLVLRTRLLLKLERLLEAVAERGISLQSFHVMSGYRTPFYNRAIGNVRYSRHVWGGAADIFIDENPRDGMMDDLDGNGRIDKDDARVLYGIVDDLFGKAWYQPFVGGLGLYEKNAVRGPFVHVDVRGFRARWGD